MNVQPNSRSQPDSAKRPRYHSPLIQIQTNSFSLGKRNLASNEIHIWYANLDEPLETQILSQAEEKRAARFRFPVLRSRFRAARSITRSILGSYLELPPQNLEFSNDEFGKPRLARFPNDRAELKFNLSHSGSAYLLGVCLRHEIGVDIEQRRAIEDRDELVHRFFHSNEVEAFQQIPESEKDEAFLLAWTRKEAILKATGTGLTAHLDSLQVTLDPRRECRLLDISPRWGPISRWSLFTPPPSGSSISSVATPYRFAKCIRHNFSVYS